VLMVENFVPYRYPAGDIAPWRPTPGIYAIRVTAYSQDNAAGFVCDIKLIYVTFVNNAPTPTPTMTPTPTATNTPPPPLAANCIGDWVWRDTNANGLQDGSEPGLAGLPVYIGPDQDNNGRLDRILASTATDGNGRYTFCALTPASYLVEFGSVDGCINTVDNQGGNDALDSDANPGYGVSPLITLNDGSADSTVDAGFICN
jgi:SdrD B-like domain